MAQCMPSLERESWGTYSLFIKPMDGSLRVYKTFAYSKAGPEDSLKRNLGASLWSHWVTSLMQEPICRPFAETAERTMVIQGTPADPFPFMLRHSPPHQH